MIQGCDIIFGYFLKGAPRFLGTFWAIPGFLGTIFFGKI